MSDLKAQFLTQVAQLTRMPPDKFPDFYREYLKRFQCNPCLTEEEIQAFENHYQITLPEEYRFYLKELGNGGTHGILPLAESLKRRFSDENPPKEYLSDDFKITTSRPLLREDLEALGYWEMSVPEQDDFWTDMLRGTIDLLDRGSGAFGVLVISGEDRGMIFEDSMYADAGIYPLKDHFWYFLILGGPEFLDGGYPSY